MHIPLYDKYPREQFADAWSKVLIYKWTEYDRILFIDNDHVLAKPLDDVFLETSAQVYQNRRTSPTTSRAKSPSLTSMFLLAAAELNGNHPYHLLNLIFREKDLKAETSTLASTSSSLISKCSLT